MYFKLYSENIFLDCVIMGLIIYGLVSSLVAQNCLKIIKENLRMFQNCWKKLRMFKNYYKIQMTRDDYKLQRIRAQGARISNKNKYW